MPREAPLRCEDFGGVRLPCARGGRSQRGGLGEGTTVGLWKLNVWQAVFSWEVSPAYKLTDGWKSWSRVCTSWAGLE